MNFGNSYYIQRTKHGKISCEVTVAESLVLYWTGNWPVADNFMFMNKTTILVHALVILILNTVGLLIQHLLVMIIDAILLLLLMSTTTGMD